MRVYMREREKEKTVPFIVVCCVSRKSYRVIGQKRTLTPSLSALVRS